MIGDQLQTLLLVPVFHPTNTDRLALVACLVNKKKAEDSCNPQNEEAEKEDSPQNAVPAFEDADRAKVGNILDCFEREAPL